MILKSTLLLIYKSGLARRVDIPQAKYFLMANYSPNQGVTGK